MQCPSQQYLDGLLYDSSLYKGEGLVRNKMRMWDSFGGWKSARSDGRPLVIRILIR